MTIDISKRLAAEAAKDLFTNGNGDHAKRLVLELTDPEFDRPGRNGGGWCEDAARDRIEAVYAPLLEAYEKQRLAIEAALRIESLWMPPDNENDPNYDGEFAALASMRQSFKEALGAVEKESEGC